MEQGALMGNEGKGAQAFTGSLIPLLQPSPYPEFLQGDLADRVKALETYCHAVSLWANQLAELLQHHGITAAMIGADQVRGPHVRSGEIGWPKLSTIKLAEVRVAPDPAVFAT